MNKIPGNGKLNIKQICLSSKYDIFLKIINSSRAYLLVFALKTTICLYLFCALPDTSIDTVNQGNWCLSIKLRLESFVIVA